MTRLPFVRFIPALLAAFLLMLPLSVQAQSETTSPPQPGRLANDAQTQQQENKAEAAREITREEHQRILGIFPNFNTIDQPQAAIMSPRQKINLAFRSAIDPVTFAVAAVDAGISQWQNSFSGYGQGGQGYAKRFGASYADSFDSTMLGNAFLPIVFHQDPRYFRKGTGPFSARFLYAVSTTVRAHRDGGGWVPNYSNILVNLAAGGISNAYYPDSDIGDCLTFRRAATVTAEGALGALFTEFWPDISRHLRKRR